ncbi:MAG TPA: hypothetical protein VMS82_14785 [Pseudolabrys sp.]|jgi:hypothetical protein|nr:hypothetical protein [Pseudolabrys sp.]
MAEEKQTLIECKLKCALTVAEVQRLPKTEHAEAAYALFGRMADQLADSGFDPSVVAHAALDLAGDLVKRDGGPVEVVSIDPRRRRAD